MRKIPDIRLIATDLDGTLLGDDHISVSERNARALRAASEQGIRLAIASGRTRSELAHVLECLPFLDYLIQANGAAVTDLKSGRILLSDDIPYEQWVRLRSLLRAYGAVYNTYCRGVSYIESDVLPRYNRTDLSPLNLSIRCASVAGRRGRHKDARRQGRREALRAVLHARGELSAPARGSAKVRRPQDHVLDSGQL